MLGREAELSAHLLNRRDHSQLTPHVITGGPSCPRVECVKLGGGDTLLLLLKRESQYSIEMNSGNFNPEMWESSH